jgi:hypothetical protein
MKYRFTTAAVALVAPAKFLAAGRWPFVCAMSAVLGMNPSPATAAEPRAETQTAWQQFVDRAEPARPACPCRAVRPEGETVDVPGGTIHRWRGSTLVEGVTLDRVLHALQQPGTPPPQEEVLESRVLSRAGSSLTVYIRMTRRAIVTVTYDTEHDVTFERESPLTATSRSVATKIEELDGGNRGFLWRLNSYWRYTQQPGGVLIELESLSLSRRVPIVVKPAAAPLIARVGRESMTRTLAALKSFLEVHATTQAATDRTATPAAASPSRSRAASRPAPGVSP